MAALGGEEDEELGRNVVLGTSRIHNVLGTVEQPKGTIIIIWKSNTKYSREYSILLPHCMHQQWLMLSSSLAGWGNKD